MTQSDTQSRNTAQDAARDICIIHVSGILRRSPEFMARRKEELAAMGYRLTHLETECPSENGFSTGTAVERAVLFAHALTNRKHPLLWAARGGFGVSEVLPYLENMLPPAIPPKTLVGFSDISLLGCYLADRYPNFRYVHASHAFDPILVSGGPALDKRVLFELLEGGIPAPLTFRMEPMRFPESSGRPSGPFEGPIVPLNLSLAESLSSLRHCSLPEGNILFVEDLNEEVYKIMRKFDSMKLSGLLDRTRAIVLGSFTACNGPDDRPVDEAHVAELVARKTRLPVFVLTVFGHDEWRLPLVYGAHASISAGADGTFARIGFDCARPALGVSSFPAGTFLPRPSREPTPDAKARIHFTGIGGTGMAAVAGLFAAAGHPVTGSDTPIYPPMDKTIRDIGIEPKVNYAAENIAYCEPDAVVLANVISRRNAELKPNAEFEHLLRDSLPLFSFPSALRHYFLHRSRNVVITGTHGKTTTTSLVAHLLTGIGLDPSFMVGGSPKNFGTGFALRSRELFVLEGDEYDSALFDKGPKFLHYEPTVALLNNIEFDHADIYADVAAIEREFERLAALCNVRGGWLVANAGCPRVRRIVSNLGKNVVWFGSASDFADMPGTARDSAWILAGETTTREGLRLQVRAPWNANVHLSIGLFGHHNALNAVAALGILHALHRHGEGGRPVDRAATSVATRTFDDSPAPWLAKALEAFRDFEGVKRRFELVGTKNDITVFDDFAHHPTAIETTLDAFKAYLRSAGVNGRLVACFDPRNATMRRRILQDQLSRSFGHADLVFLGKVAVDKRLAEDEILDGPTVAKSIGSNAAYFADNDVLCENLRTVLRPGDTVVFMSSGAFDNLPRKLLDRL